VSHAVAQRLIGELVADEIAGDFLVYDNQGEFFSASSAPSGSASSPGTATSRVRVILAPREAAPAASSPQSAEPAGDKP
jgi:lipopolysaccharide export system protein LptA